MIDRPKRIQRKRTKGWRMPEGAIYVGRGSMWGNPVRVGEVIEGERFGQTVSAATAVAIFRDLVQNAIGVEIYWQPIRGHDLACWCPLDQPCHADVLLELANS